MRIAVLGTGRVGRTIAGRLNELGHQVSIGTRDPHAASDELTAWLAAQPAITLRRFSDAAESSELVFNATSGAGTLAALEAAGEDNLTDKVLVDLSNPLDFSRGMPPTLFVSNDDSLGEQVQRRFPRARVVKTLNTVTADLMVHPEALERTSTVFVSGDDGAAKVAVTELLLSFGHTDVLDLGGIETARGVESYLPLWLRVMRSVGSATFNVHVVR